MVAPHPPKGDGRRRATFQVSYSEAGGRSVAKTPGKPPAKLPPHSGGVPASRNDASGTLVGCVGFSWAAHRGYRCAQPPATSCEPFGFEAKAPLGRSDIRPL